MRKTISEIFTSIQKLLGLINRTINSLDAVVEAVEANATAYRDEEINRLRLEATSKTEA